ncbi:unnamed protein product [marine sediment metagenome]|uniref:Uncharacterized protein n=1 Tax=marine sediment metagenome TaxID=412755 RepID=X0SA57_9ZZZZ
MGPLVGAQGNELGIYDNEFCPSFYTFDDFYWNASEIGVQGLHTAPCWAPGPPTGKPFQDEIRIVIVRSGISGTSNHLPVINQLRGIAHRRSPVREGGGTKGMHKSDPQKLMQPEPTG